MNPKYENASGILVPLRPDYFWLLRHDLRNYVIDECREMNPFLIIKIRKVKARHIYISKKSKKRKMRTNAKDSEICMVQEINPS